MATGVKRMLIDYYSAWNTHDVQMICSFFTDDCVYEDVALEKGNHSKQELETFLSFTTAPDMKFQIKSFFNNGDWIAHEWIMTGTQSGPLGGIPATGKRF